MGSPIVPVLRYRNAAAAIEWLCTAFAFEKLMVVLREGGRIAHSRLTYGDGMIMVGEATAEVGGALHGMYVVVEDIDSHAARAAAGGAVMVIPLRDDPHGGRSYVCTDVEGFTWTFGTLNPWT